MSRLPKRVWSGKKLVFSGKKAVREKDWQIWVYKPKFEEIDSWEVYTNKRETLDPEAPLDVYDSSKPEYIGTMEDGILATYTFYDHNRSVLKQDTCKDGEIPIPPADPTRESDWEYDYQFAWWDPEVGPITRDTDYVAMYNATKRIYTVSVSVNDSSYGSVDITELTVEAWTEILDSSLEPTLQPNQLMVWSTVVTATAESWYEFDYWTNWSQVVTWDEYPQAVFKVAVQPSVYKARTTLDNWSLYLRFYDENDLPFLSFLYGTTPEAWLTMVDKGSFPWESIETSPLTSSWNATQLNPLLASFDTDEHYGWHPVVWTNLWLDQIVSENSAEWVIDWSLINKLLAYIADYTIGTTAIDNLIRDNNLQDTLIQWEQSPAGVTPLTITAVQDRTQVNLNKYGSVDLFDFEISSDGSTWRDLTWQSSGQSEDITLNNGDVVYIRNKSTTDVTLATSPNDRYGLSIGGWANLSGDITTLINKNGTDTLCDYCFYNLFYYSDIITPPEMNVTTVWAHACEGMFSQCSKLTTTPALPATNLGDGCYQNMFFNCQSLTTISDLPATTIPDSAYMQMYMNCKLLKMSNVWLIPNMWYVNSFRVPTTWTWTAWLNAMYLMFQGIASDSLATWNMDLNTEWWTTATVIPAN